MIKKSELTLSISKLDIPLSIVSILKQNNVISINDLWVLNRKQLKQFGLSDTQINQIVIKMQLFGIDLNKKSY